jgi:hypothetical protein
MGPCARLPAQPRELGALIGRDAVVALTAIDLVLAMPVAQCLLGDAKALGQLAGEPIRTPNGCERGRWST